MRKRKFLLFLLGAVLCFSGGCAQDTNTESADSTAVSTEKSGQTDKGQQTETQTEISPTDISQTDTSQSDLSQTDRQMNTTENSEDQTEIAGTDQTMAGTEDFGQESGNFTDAGTNLYISTGNQNYQNFSFTGSEVTPDTLVQGIADLTGWNLELADTITSGKGGMTVSFSGSSAIFSGPPEVQKDEFHVYDAESMVFAVLDSIQMTLQNYASPVNPSSVDIYFCMEGDVPITLDNLGVTLPMDQPYSHESLAALFAGAQPSE